MLFAAKNQILKIPRLYKRAIAVTVDTILCVLTVGIAYYLRLGYWIFPSGNLWIPVIVAVMIALPIFISNGLYRAIFRYSGWDALGAIVKSGLMYGIFYSVIFTLMGVPQVPRTIGIIQPILLFLALTASRAFIRLWFGDSYITLLERKNRKNVLIYGAGAAGRQLAAAIAQSADMRLCAYVDDNRKLHGSTLNGVPIYTSQAIPKVISDYVIDDVLLALPSSSRKRRAEILKSIGEMKVNVRTLPGLSDIAHGKVTIADLKTLDVDDLLGRGAVPPDAKLMRQNIAGLTVAVTGAGGSIGSELCRQIIRLQPRAILLIERNEFSLYSIHRELEAIITTAKLAKPPELLPLLASVTDEHRIAAIMDTWRPETVYHAAAFKHVPLVEQNPIEGLKNNAFGTLITARAAQRSGVRNFILISTDKAVRPTSVMGSTKRLAEMILQAIADENGIRFSMVRFGNVLDSSGSVVPLFRRQIAEGGPVTVTHSEVTRYFMTIPEAAQLVIQAGAMSVSGEVFVLDMGDPVRIIDLAHNMIKLSGLTVRDAKHPDGDIEIAVVGLRHGEKLYEELLIGDDPQPTRHPKIMRAQEDFLDWPQLEKELQILQRHIDSACPASIIATLKSIIPDFTPEQDLADLIYLHTSN